MGYAHAAGDYTAQEMLTAYVAERLDRLADRMLARGAGRLGMLGRLGHADWLSEHIAGLSSLPISAYLTPPGYETSVRQRGGAVVLPLEDPASSASCDAVLISDDRHESALEALALRWFPPGVIIHTIYDRLAIGREALPRSASMPTRAPAGPARPVVRVRDMRPGSPERASWRVPALSS